MPRVTVPVLVALALAAGCGGPRTRADGPPAAAAPHPDTTRFWPVPFAETWLGMPFEDFRAAHPTAGEPDRTFAFRLVVDQPAPAPGVTEVTWYFDADLPGQPLYEAIVALPEGTDARAAAEARYGPPTAGDDWHYDTALGYPVRVWAFQNKIVVAAGMPGTEWENEW